MKLKWAQAVGRDGIENEAWLFRKCGKENGFSRNGGRELLYLYIRKGTKKKLKIIGGYCCPTEELNK